MKSHHKTFSIEQFDVHERKALLLLSILCFYLHIRGITNLYSPFLYTEEFGYWANAAALAKKYNWIPSILKSNTPWYAYGYSMTLVPLFWLFDDMVYMYRAAIVLNGLWSSLSFLLCYSLTKKFSKNSSKFLLLLISFIISLYSAYLHQSSIAIVETFLYFLIWLLFWLFVKFEEKPKLHTGILLGCVAAFVYLTHHRTIGILIAFFITMLFMVGLKKISWKQCVCAIFPIFFIMCLDHRISHYLSIHVWAGTASTSDDYLHQLLNLKNAFTNLKYFVNLIRSIIGKCWYACAASFMLCFWGVIYTINLLWKGIKKERQLMCSFLFFLLSYASIIAISAIFTINPKSRTDMLIYGRYAECAAGIFIIFGFLELIDLSYASSKKKIIVMALSFISFLGATVILEQYFKELSSLYDMARVDHMVNSTSGIFFFHLIGNFSFWNIFLVSMSVALLLAFGFVYRKNILYLKPAVCLLLLACFLYTGEYTAKHYTFLHQKGNNDSCFVETISLIESSMKGKKIFIENNNLYVFCDFQSRAIHNTIYPGDIETINKSSEYDAVIISSDNLFSFTNENYSLLNINDKYALFTNKAL